MRIIEPQAYPFSHVDISYSAPSFVDVDGDGDFDAFIAEDSSTINYYRNNGTANSPSFTEVTGASNPFDGVDVGNKSTPSFVDMDNDGDYDAFIGEGSSTIGYYRNDGTASSPSFTEVTGASNPFDGVDVGSGHRVPSFVDVDGDGDYDAFIGEYSGTIKYYRNDGTASSPSFTEVTGASNPLYGVDVGYASTPSFVDVDGDGDYDAFIGEKGGSINYYRNDGTVSSPSFTEWSGPLYGVDVGYNSIPRFVDVDNDGDYDAFVGAYNGTINYYRNDGTASGPSFTFINGVSNHPFNGVDVGYYSTPSFVDVDNDGDYDAFIGERDGTINYYRNDGTASSPSFTEVSGASNPFDGVGVGKYGTPSFVDVDNDGDYDAFIGGPSGTINYYRNDGTASSPSFTKVTGASNPFDGVDVGDRSTPSFVDVDGDSDYDAFIGEYNGIINYYRNNGTANSPSFTEVTEAGNPFDGVDVGVYSAPSFVDVDSDGDYDAFIGEHSGTIYYYRNDGTANSPSFTAVTGASNPFDGVKVGFSSTPNFVDVDDDGDYDAFIGEYEGTINYYRNDTPQDTDNDVIIDFGPGTGIYARLNNNSWLKYMVSPPIIASPVIWMGMVWMKSFLILNLMASIS